MIIIYIPTPITKIGQKESGHYTRLLNRLILVYLNRTESDFINDKIVSPIEYDLLQDCFIRFDIVNNRLTIEEFQSFLNQFMIDVDVNRQSYFIHNERGLSESDYQLHHNIDQQLYGKKYTGVIPIKAFSIKKIQEYFQNVICNFDAWLVTDDKGQIIQKGDFCKNLIQEKEFCSIEISDQDDIYKTICFSHGGGRKSCLLSIIFGVLYTHRGSYQKRYVTKERYQNPFVKWQMHQHHRSVSIEIKLLDDCGEIELEFYDQVLIELLKGCTEGGDFDNPYLLLSALFVDEKMPSYNVMKEYISTISLQNIYQLFDK